MIFTPILMAAHRLLYGPMPGPVPDGAERGCVLIADGVGGFDLCATGLRYAVGWADAPLRVHTVGWGHGMWRWHRDLTNTRNHVAQSRILADEVLAIRARRPGTPVFLIGKSGGSVIVTRALELLPEGAISRAILLAPALSPHYDLSRALQAIEHDLTVFWSPLDVIILGAGTLVFGTADRVNSASAGLIGFRSPTDADPAMYRKLRQVRWRPRMARRLYCGGHVGIDNPYFLREHVVPLLETASTASTADSDAAVCRASGCDPDQAEPRP